MSDRKLSNDFELSTTLPHGTCTKGLIFSGNPDICVLVSKCSSKDALIKKIDEAAGFILWLIGDGPAISSVKDDEILICRDDGTFFQKSLLTDDLEFDIRINKFPSIKEYYDGKTDTPIVVFKQLEGLSIPGTV